METKRVLLVALVTSVTLLAEDKSAAEKATGVVDEAVKTPPRTDIAIRTTTQALRYFHKRKTTGIAKRVYGLATDQRQHERVRAAAIRTLGVLPDPPLKESRSLFLGLIKDPRQKSILRHYAAVAFRNGDLADAAALFELEAVLKRPDDNSVLQRSCLYAIAEKAPLEKVRQLLMNRAVYGHKYFGIRIDVCTGLAALNARSPLALEILCRYMEEADPMDTRFMVPQEAWLSFWVLTGRAHGADDPGLFAQPPAPLLGKARRALLFRPSQLRNGVTYKMVQAFQGLAWKNAAEVQAARRKREPLAPTRDAAALKKVAALSRADIPAILKRWQAGAKK